MASDDLIREAQDPGTTPARLQELATTDPATWAAIAANPAAYDGLLEWLGRKGDDSVRAVIAARGSARPTEIIPPPTTVEPVVTAEDTVSLDPTPADVEQTTQMPSYGSVPPTGPSSPTDGSDHIAPAASSTPSGGRRNTLVLAGMVAAVLVLIGGVAFGATQVFGGDDDSSDEATTSRTTPADDPTDPSPETSTEPAPEEPPADAPDASGDFCEAMKVIQDPGALGGGTDLEDAQNLIQQMTQAFEDLESSAPDEIRDEVEIMGSYLDALTDPSGDDASELAENADDYAAAIGKVGTYYATNCL